MNKEVKNPLIDFLEFFMHLHNLNSYFINVLSKHKNLQETLSKAKELIQKIEPEEKKTESVEVEKRRAELTASIEKEILENYYTIKSSELMVLYSRLESAINETIHLVFQKEDITKMEGIQKIKIDAIPYLELPNKEKKSFLADQYIIQTSQSIKYGFSRFESLLKPLFGPSDLPKKTKDSLFKFAQVRNLITHKNGIIDRQFKEIFKAQKYKLNKQLQIDSKMLNEFYSATLAYVEDILDRIQKRVIEK